MTEKRMCAGILFQDKLIDVGLGVLTNLVRSRTKLNSINEVYVSHVHSDHVGDFTGLVWAMAMEERTKPLRVVSSAKTASAMRELLELQATPKPWIKFDIVYVRPEQAGTPFMPTLHEPENLAYRFEKDGVDFVYVGDTRKYDKVAEFSRDCDLIIHDSTFLNGQEPLAELTNHSTASDAGTIAKAARARRLVLTHISPGNGDLERKYLAQAGERFDGKVIVATDNLVLTV